MTDYSHQKQYRQQQIKNRKQQELQNRKQKWKKNNCMDISSDKQAKYLTQENLDMAKIGKPLERK